MSFTQGALYSGFINMLKLISLLIIVCIAFGSFLPDEKKSIGTYIPDIPLEIHTGEVLRIKEFAGGKVIIINPIYTRCSSACPLMTEGLKRAIKDLMNDVKVISLSFDPRDSIEDLKRFARHHSLPENWVVAKSEQVDSLLKSIDFRYRYDKSLEEFEHPNLYVVITPSGKISRYIYGVNPKVRDIKLSVLEAKRESSKLSPVEGFFLRCFRYDPDRGDYQIDWFFVFDVMGGLLTFLVVPALVWGKSAYKSLHDFIVKKS